MRKPMFSFNKKITSKSIHDGLSNKEKEHLDKFRDYLLISASASRVNGAIVEVLRFRKVVGKSLFDIDLEDLRYFLKELQISNFSDHTKNKIKDFIQRFLRWSYKDWSERFNEFHDIKINTDAQRKKPITTKECLTEEQIMKLLEAEPTLYWKTFLITQSEGGLRTGETRMLKWDMVNFEDDGFTTLNIPSKKNRNGTIKINPVVVKVAGNFLKKLKEQQDKYELKTPYVFPSPYNKNKPISKSVNLWFSALCKKVLGHTSYNYILRHSKGTILQKKVREGTLSKDNAVEFMRHSEKMFDKVYSHMDKDDIKALMKKQIYDTKKLTKEVEHKLELENKQIRKELEEIRKMMDEDLADLRKQVEENAEKKMKAMLK